MPHTFAKTKITPDDLVQNWTEKSFHLDSVRIKIQRGYSHPSNHRCIFPCIVIESFNDRRFYIEVRKKDKDRLIIHLDPFTPVPRTAGIRLALALFSQHIKKYDKNCIIEKRNISEYFNLLNLEPSLQLTELARLQDKLAPQMKAFDLRSKANWYTLFLEKSNPPLDWKEIFGNSHPVEIEIGPGKGKFIFNEAQTHPEHSYLAIEWTSRYLKILTEKIPKVDIKNIRLLKADARVVFKEWIPPSSITKIHIYYPDPWWKRKHQKYKLFSNEFIHSILQALTLNGIISLATDVQEIYDSVNELIKPVKCLVNIHNKVYHSGKDVPPGRSNFEIKKWQDEHIIYEAKWQKEKTDDMALSN